MQNIKESIKANKDLKLKQGDIIEVSLPLTWGRGGDNNSLYAYYPLINGERCSGIPIINKLIEKGMILKEIS